MGDDYDIGTIREMLVEAFADSGDLRRFCLDNPALRPLVAEFGSGMGLIDMADEVIDFCRTRLAWDDLMAGVQKERGAVYAKFAPKLGGSPQVAPPRPQPFSPMPSAVPAIRILFLAANPQDTNPLRLDEEVRAIDEALLKSPFRDRFDLIQHWAVRVSELQGLLLRHQPHIVHFSGHGSEFSQIILQDAQGNAQPVPTRALTGVFTVLKDNIRCVVLNACYSQAQAQAIAKEIECVAGMSKAIGDEAAISFAASFYRALGYGRNVKTAFELGCLEIHMEGLREEDTPKLKTKHGVDAAKVFLVEPVHG